MKSPDNFYSLQPIQQKENKLVDWKYLPYVQDAGALAATLGYFLEKSAYRDSAPPLYVIGLIGILGGVVVKSLDDRRTNTVAFIPDEYL